MKLINQDHLIPTIFQQVVSGGTGLIDFPEFLTYVSKKQNESNQNPVSDFFLRIHFCSQSLFELEDEKLFLLKDLKWTLIKNGIVSNIHPIFDPMMIHWIEV